MYRRLQGDVVGVSGKPEDLILDQGTYPPLRYENGIVEVSHGLPTMRLLNQSLVQAYKKETTV